MPDRQSALFKYCQRSFALNTFDNFILLHIICIHQYNKDLISGLLSVSLVQEFAIIILAFRIVHLTAQQEREGVFASTDCELSCSTNSLHLMSDDFAKCGLYSGAPHY